MNACVTRNAVGSSWQVGLQPSFAFVLPSSHCSPASMTPLPQRGWQSLSLSELQPLAQQPSLLVQDVIVTLLQAAMQVPPETSESCVQALLSLQSAAVGHFPVPLVIAVSQVSPWSTLPLPQVAAQSLSVSCVQPDGQQPSPPAHAVMGVFAHAAVQVPLFMTESVVQTWLSLQSAAVGHLPVPLVMPVSQVSP